MNKLELVDQMTAAKSDDGNVFTSEAALISEVEGEEIQRVALYTRIENMPDDDGMAVYYVICGLEGGRELNYRLADTDGFVFNEDRGEAEFASGGIQYKIRALQDTDKSWIIDIDSSEPTKKTGATK